MSASPLNREELLRDSQATLREVAGVLQELWNLQRFESDDTWLPAIPSKLSRPGADIEQVLEDTRREVSALQTSIRALHQVLPSTLNGTHEGSQGPANSAGAERGAGALEILREVQTRLDRLTHAIDNLDVGSK